MYSHNLPFDSSVVRHPVGVLPCLTLVFHTGRMGDGGEVGAVASGQWTHGPGLHKKDPCTNQITPFFLAGIALTRPLGHWHTHSDTAVVLGCLSSRFHQSVPVADQKKNEGLGEDTNTFAGRAV